MFSQTYQLSPTSFDVFRRKLLAFGRPFVYSLFLDNCQTNVDRYGQYELLAGFADETAATIETWKDFETRSAKGVWLGALPYELNALFEPSLTRLPAAELSPPETAFFQPQIRVSVPRNLTSVTIWAEDPQAVLQNIWEQNVEDGAAPQDYQPAFVSNFDRERYIKTIERCLENIVDGDVYEINLTQQFVANLETIDSVDLFLRLTRLSPTPFAALFRFRQWTVAGASPERFLKRKENQLITQPIKGTVRRDSDPAKDEALKQALVRGEKERSENVMIVDLARNDLNRSCEAGSVAAPHLFEAQTFQYLHHLVSTVTGTLRPEVSAAQALRNAFPPGSMTGAPKVRSMELIGEYEQTGRGFYSGAIGYLFPNEFDFNVVIRSLVYNALQKRLSYHVGGAITYESDPAAEYEESLLKAKAIGEL